MAIQRILTAKQTEAMFAAIDEGEANRQWREFVRKQKLAERPVLTRNVGDMIKLVDILAIGAPEVKARVHRKDEINRLYLVECECDFCDPEVAGVWVDENGHIVSNTGDTQ